MARQQPVRWWAVGRRGCACEPEAGLHRCRVGAGDDIDDAYKVAEALGAGHIIWHQGARLWYVGHVSSVADSFEAAQPTIIARLAA